MLTRNTVKFIHKSLLVLSLLTTMLYANKGERLWTYKLAGNNFDASAAIDDVVLQGSVLPFEKYIQKNKSNVLDNQYDDESCCLKFEKFISQKLIYEPFN